MGRRRTGTPPALDAAFAEPPGGTERRRLVGDLLAGPFQRYARAVRADQESYISLDEGLSVISKHAKERARLRRDRAAARRAGALAGRLHRRPRRRSARRRRRSPSSSSRPSTSGPPRSSASCPRQRDLRDLVGKDAAGARSPACSTRSSTGTAGSTRSAWTTATSRRSSHERLLQAQGRRRQGRARRRVRPGRQRPGRRPGTSCSTRTASEGDREAFRADLPVQPGVRARDGRHLRRAAAGADRAQAHAAAARRLPRHAAGRPAHAARRDLRRAGQRRRPPVHRQAARRVRDRRSGSTPSGSARTCCSKHGLTEEQAAGLRPHARVPRRRPGRQDAAARRAGAERARAATA